MVRQGSVSERSEKADETSGPAGAASGSERTAVFRTVRPDADRSPEAKPGSGSGSDSGSGSAGGTRTTAFGVVTSDPAPDSASGGADEGSAKSPAGSERTAVFRTVKPGSAPADSAKAADEDRPADSEPGSGSGGQRTTAFGVATSDPAPEAEDAESGKPAARDPRGAEPSERTAVFRTVRPGSAPADAGKKVPAESERDSATPSAGSERTAVFRAVKPGSAPADADAPAPAARDPRTAGPDTAKKTPTAPADERTAAFRPVKPGQAPADGERTDGPSAPGRPGQAPADADGERTAGPSASARPGQAPADAKAPAPADAGEKAPAAPADERTAVFRKVKPGSGAADGDGKPAADSERTAVFRAVKPGSAPGKPADADGKPGAPKAAPAPEARVSKFVPLRPDDQPAPPKPAAPKPDPATAPTVRRLDPSERTTQQPLPPRPPLDMLADLTNNPPPPPSPMRTVVRRVKIYAPIVALLVVVLAVVQLVRPLPAPKLVLTAKSQYTFPGGAPDLPWPSEGQASMAAAGLGTIGSSGEQKPVPIASVTKSMTAYIIMRDHPFKKGEKGAMIDVDKTAEAEGQKDKSDNESTLNTVKEGDKISEYDAIAALMIPSANNIARLLARWDAGSQEAFVKKMNDTAKQLGMTNTTYTDPSGLDATTVSTAEDQVKLGLKIVEIDAMVDITRKPSWTDQTGKNWPNWNRLVPYNESLGIKTGTTTKAGGNLLFAAYKKVGDTNQLIVGAVLGQHKPPIIDTVIAASKNLLVATQKSLDGAPVVKKGDVVGYVDDGVGGRTKVVATADVQAVGWSSLTVDIKLGDGGTKIPETAKAGTAVGVLTVGDGASQVKVPVALQSELAAPGIGSKLTRIG
ncbi:hypothetical protein [Streptomyces sp. NPDC059708]|uniref:D-alanyl-D-alanine carboxypeptidase n=1 Tax=Streptomyces sp. NPDC059708 TaxID=3346916 RepID=UPI0036B398E4